MPLAVRAAIFTVLLPGTATVLIPAILLGADLEVYSFNLGGLRAAGAIAMLAGGGLVLWCILDFATVGRGTLAPVDAPTTLVMTGPYQYVRNPMYVAVLLIVAGEAVFFGSVTLVLYTVLLAAAFHNFIVRYEEPSLVRTFGAHYLQYCRAVPRWWPNLSRE
jgi:protein-S-isoprenylcysteine O-methyltransferase Ste14